MKKHKMRDIEDRHIVSSIYN